MLVGRNHGIFECGGRQAKCGIADEVQCDLEQLLLFLLLKTKMYSSAS